MSINNKQWLGLPLNLLWGYIAIAVFMTGDGFELAFLSHYIKELGFSPAQASFAFTLYGLAAALSAWISGVVAEIITPLKTMMIGFVLWCVFHVLFLVFGLGHANYALILVFYGIRGFAYPLFLYSFIVAIIHNVKSDNASSAIGWLWAVYSIGIGVFGSYIPSFTIPHIGELGTLWLALAFCVTGGIIALASLRHIKTPHHMQNLTTREKFAELGRAATLLYTIIRPINTEFPPSLNIQDGLYTTAIRGLDERGEAVSEARIIRSVNNEINPWQDFAGYLALARNPAIAFVFSNTTESGISYHAGDRPDDKPPVSFPAKLTQLLFERFRHFNGAADKGWTMIPCELIDYNGEALKALVLRYAEEWQLPAAFRDWVETANTFCSTLVDRIVTGYPREEAEKLEAELGYHDAFLDTAEYFWLFVIQGPQALAKTLRLECYPLNIRLVEDIRPYKERKVAILNGAHTALVPVAWLCGLRSCGCRKARR